MFNCFFFCLSCIAGVDKGIMILCYLTYTVYDTHTCRHVIYAPSSVNSYGSSLFPGVSDAIFNAVNFNGSWDDVRRQLDFVRNHIRYATAVMAEPSLNYAPIK